MESELERGVFAILQATVIIHSRDYGIWYTLLFSKPQKKKKKKTVYTENSTVGIP